MQGTNQRRYRARAKEAALGESSTGKEQIAVLFEVLTPDAEFSSLTWYGFFTEDTADRTIESLRHCGWDGEDLTDLRGLDKNEVELVVEDEEYEGKTYTRVRWVNRVGLALKAPLTGDRAKAFAAQMRGRIRAVDAANGIRRGAAPASAPSNGNAGRTPPPPSSPPEPPPHTDDDIPF